MIQTVSERGVLEVCIDRPEKKNALTRAMYEELASILHAARADKDCGSILLYGSGGNFTSGADIKDFQVKRGAGDSPAVTFLRALDRVEVPLIAAVEGYAIGIGTTLLQHCDFVYSAPNARFRLPFVALGLCPEGGSSFLLERIVGVRRARDWLLSARPFDGAEAFDAGFVTRLVEAGKVLEVARETARQLGELPRESVLLTKRMLKRDTDSAVSSAFDHEVQMYAERLKSPETQEIFKRFLAG